MRGQRDCVKASPGSTASQTGVPHSGGSAGAGHPAGRTRPAPGWTESTMRAVRLWPVATLLPPPRSPAAGTICSPVLIKMLTAKKKNHYPLHPLPFPHPARPPWRNQPEFRSFLLSPAATGPDKCCRPGATCHPLQLTNIPVPQQISSPPLAPCPALRASPGCRTNPVACSDLPHQPRGFGAYPGVAGEAVSVRAHGAEGGEVILTERPED